MVDLVKIRKRAKKPPTVDGSQLPVAEAGPAEKAESETVSPLEPAMALPISASSTDNQQPSTVSKLDRFKAEAGQRRQGLVGAGEAIRDENHLELLTFLVAGELYAVDIETIVQIVTPRPITRVPNADGSIVGIISLRGMIVTLLDVRRKLRHPKSVTQAADPRIIVIERLGETVGFEVDRVVRVTTIELGAVEPHPVVHASEQDEAIRGVFRQGDALTILLDLDKLLQGGTLPSPAA